MSGKDFEVGDLVWAKMKCYPYWPAQIVTPPANAKIQNTKKAQHWVYFFGSKNYGWILDEFIVPHSEEMIQSCKKKKSSMFQSAIDEIVGLSKIPKKDVTSVVEDKKEDIKVKIPSRKPLQIGDSSRKRAVDIKRVDIKRVVKKEKVQNRKIKRRYSTDELDFDRYYSNPSTTKSEDDYSALLANVPPSTGYSRVAVIRPYDDDSYLHQSSKILARPDYVERPLTPSLDIMKVSDALQVKHIKATEKKIGFLGLGMIGRGIVKNLLNSGHKVTVWNRTPDRCEPFVNAGADSCLTPSDVVASCDITFCCVSDPEAVKCLVFGNCGVLQGFESCTVGAKGFVEMSSIDPTTSLEIAEAITLAGGKYLEAPISGSRQRAEDGTLLALAAGDRELFNECQSCFYALSKNTYYLSSAVGSGSRTNLVLSMFYGTAYAALAEAMALIERCKLSPSNFLEILGLGALNCPLLLDKGQAMLSKNFETNTALKHQQKDLNLALSMGDACQQPLSISSAANELFKRAKRLRYADHDVSAVLLGAKY